MKSAAQILDACTHHDDNGCAETTRFYDLPPVVCRLCAEAAVAAAVLAERERMAEVLALYRTMRLTPFVDEANNTTAGWMMAFRDYEKAMDAAAGLTGDEIAAAIRGRKS